MDQKSEKAHRLSFGQVISGRIIAGPILILLIIGIILILLDRQEIVRALRLADWQMIAPAMFFTAISYLCISYTYTLLAGMWGIHMQSRDLTEICFVTTALNHVIRSGGVAGYSVRYLLMSRWGVTFNQVISSSLIHHYLTSLDMLVMLPIALLYLLLNVTLSAEMAIILNLAVTLIIIFTIMITLFFTSLGFRKRILHLLDAIIHRVLRRNAAPKLKEFSAHLSHGQKALRRNSRKTALLMALTLIDWTSSVIVLGICFNAFGVALPFGGLIASFMIGIMSGVLSALPGGIGVQEGSMVGIALLFGANFEQAILAALLFRVIYYFVPYGLSLLFYWRLVRPTGWENSC